MTLTPMYVRVSDPSAQLNLEALGVRFRWYDLRAEFEYDPDTNTMWMWAAKINVWDSGRIVCGMPEFLRTAGWERAHGIVLGHLEDVWRGDHDPKRERWHRLRKTPKRGQGGWTEHLYVRAPENGATAQAMAAAAPLTQSMVRKRVTSDVDELVETV